MRVAKSTVFSSFKPLFFAERVKRRANTILPSNWHTICPGVSTRFSQFFRHNVLQGRSNRCYHSISKGNHYSSCPNMSISHFQEKISTCGGQCLLGGPQGVFESPTEPLQSDLGRFFGVLRGIREKPEPGPPPSQFWQNTEPVPPSRKFWILKLKNGHVSISGLGHACS